MKSPDPASLQNLNDIVLPAATGWWPLATGWYVVLILLLLALVWFAYQVIQRWTKNRYRRAALGELESITAAIEDGSSKEISLRQIPVLLKRSALSAFPRNEVASLSGGRWYDFLNSKVLSPLFTETVTNTLENISYSTGDLSTVKDQEITDLLGATRHWIKNHQITVSRTAGKES